MRTLAQSIGRTTFQFSAIFLISVSCWAAKSNGKNNHQNPMMPPVAFMNMQQQEGLQSQIEKKQQFVTATETELTRLDKEMQKTTSNSNPKLMTALRNSKKMHQQNLAQAKIDLDTLEKQRKQFTTRSNPAGSQRFFSKNQGMNSNTINK